MKWLTIILLIAVHVESDAQAKTHQRFLVTTVQVARSLKERGLTVSEDQISLPASIFTANAESLLDVDSIEPLGVGLVNSSLRSKVKLVCRSPENCIPFYAIVDRPLYSSVPVFATIFPNHRPSVRSVLLPLVVHAGSSATLIVDTGSMHIQVPVICLQNGSIGARIHVVSPDRKQKYTATIVGPTLLTGSL